MLALLLSSLSFLCVQQDAPSAAFQLAVRFDEHYKTAGFGRVVFFFSFPRDPELRKTRSKLKVTVAVRGEEGKHQLMKEDRGDGTADDQTAPGVVRLRVMYLTQHCMLRKSVSLRAPLERVERLKLGSCNCAIMASVECDRGRDLCLVSRYCLNHAVSSASGPPHQKPFCTAVMMTMAKRSPSTDHCIGFPTFAHFTWPAGSTSWNQIKSLSQRYLYMLG